MVMALTYRLFLERLTFFEWNRWYLLIGIVLCLILPVLPIPFIFQYFQEYRQTINKDFYSGIIVPFSFKNDMISSQTQGKPLMNFWWLFRIILIATYAGGVFYRMRMLIAGLYTLFQLKKESFRKEKGAFYNLYFQDKFPTFSFFNYIFLNTNTGRLSESETEQILLHEKTHVVQKHSLDVMLYELIGIAFWFNPAVFYMSESIRLIHEYLVDSQVTSFQFNKAEYGRLLVKLATRQSRSAIISTFSNTQIFHRIAMLTKPKSNNMQKLKFLSLIPLLSLIVLLCSFLEGNKDKPVQGKSVAIGKAISGGKTIGRITWSGNTKYTGEQLNQILGFKTGDLYDSVQFDNRLHFLEDGKDVSSLYLEKGYLFFRIEKQENIRNNKVDLMLKVYEGQKATIRNITVKGNKKVSTDVILNLIELKKEDLFNRSKLINSQRALSKSGYFVPDQININPMPDSHSFHEAETGFVDIEFVVTEL